MIAVFGFAGSAFAIHLDIPSDDSTPVVSAGTASLTISGEIRARYDFRHVSFNNNTPDTAFFDQRVRLGFEAKLSPNTKGFIQLETDAGDTALSSAPDSVVWGSPNANTSPGSTQDSRTQSKGYPNGAQVGNNLKPGFSILNAWIQHSGTGLLGVNSGFKVGHQPIQLPNALFLDHSYYGDDGIVLFVNPIKELEIDAIYLKLRQQVSNTSSSTNGYALALNYKPSKVTSVSADLTYLDVQNIGETVAVNTPVLYPDVHLWNLGVRGNTEIAGIRLMVDGEAQSGNETISGINPIPANLIGGKGNLHYGGYALKAGLGYTLQPVKLTLEWAYGSGNNGKNDNKDNTFITFQGPTPHFSYVFDYRTLNAAGSQFGGLQNVMYLKLDANADVAKDVNVDVAIMQLQAAHAVKWVKGTTTNNYAGFTNPSGSQGNSNIGTEIDGSVSYQIDKGLRIYAEGGYLFAGDFWKAGQSTGNVAFPVGSSVKDAYTVREGIILNF